MGDTKALIQKLEVLGPLPSADVSLLNDTASGPRTTLAVGSSFIREGDKPSEVLLVLRGIAQRSKIIEDGRRQIFAFLLPGDLCDSHVFELDEMDHDIVALTECLVTTIRRGQMMELMKRPAIARAIWISTMIDEAMLREWLVNLGQRDSEQRVAHMYCEVHQRMSLIGLASPTQFRFPISQASLADAMGITTVHANRVLQSLKRRKLLLVAGGNVVIPELGKLRDFCGFRSNYLHWDIGASRDG